jgi:Mce-associated membrane protein
VAVAEPAVRVSPRGRGNPKPAGSLPAALPEPSGRVTLARGARLAGRRFARRLAGAALLAVAAGLAATAVHQGAAVRDDRAIGERRQAVLAAARQEAVNFTTLDYRTLDRDLARVADGATGDFRTQFLGQGDQLRSLLTANRAVSTGQVLQAGLVSDTAGTAEVLLAVDSRVTNTATPAGAVRHYRIQLDLQLVSGRWRTSQLRFVG